MVAAGIKFDFIVSSFSRLRLVKDNGYLGGDISDLIKKYNFDLSRIEDAYLNQARDINGGKLTSLPFYDIRMLLYYNKDVFNKFGVPYPKDGMTWEDVYPLARSLTRMDNGVQYFGFGSHPGNLLTNGQNSYPYIDYKTETSKLQTDQWKNYIEKLVPLYTAGGSYKPTRAVISAFPTSWSKNKTTAMYVQYNSDARDTNTAFMDSWDVVTLPEFSDMKGVGSRPFPVYLTIPSTIDPKHRDDAFLAIEALLTDEVQRERSENNALYPILKDSKIKETFGKTTDYWVGKNLKAVAAQRPAAAIPYSEYDTMAESAIMNAALKVITGETDINTALREADDSLNKQIIAKK